MLNKILSCLADGAFHSGEALARTCSSSKTTVHNKIKQIKAYGIEVSAVRGKGYRIFGGLDLLDERKIAQALPGIELSIPLEITSTNDACRKGLDKQPNQTIVCSAEKQSAGRGRRGKRWFSPFAKNIYLSIGFQLMVPMTQVSGITLAVGVTLAKWLTHLGIKGVGIKWPNDVYIDSHKVAGILTEVTGDAQGPCSVVIGIGLNVLPCTMDLDIQQKTTCLKDHGIHVPRSEILIQLIKAMLAMRELYEKTGLSAFVKEWELFDVLHHKAITIKLHDRQIEAQCLGITKDGLLAIDTPPYELAAGEVSVRAL